MKRLILASMFALASMCAQNVHACSQEDIYLMREALRDYSEGMQRILDEAARYPLPNNHNFDPQVLKKNNSKRCTRNPC